ncbi:hypothetical protein CONPUDRAFT_153854 [Coniophora puteana RWD-64-598 SS2]|uniref:Uncharacterized protein n=1 Tax=Coniophora puteana (strain RWD-64-598) TaxID=741705 RepID=A0A5M3MRL8_CONPW|nr:uncharacterized protein CONPUDRAFT_153854 [Coniophora puteana RWD-64-598 SS2]EIW81305.1 hypothetical protein CONPUDRAFT_153854 [Coniophora puteana RWD-64-598 SS2]
MDVNHDEHVITTDNLDDVNEKLEQFQVSSTHSSGKLLPSPYLPPELAYAEAHYPNRRPRRAFFGFAVSSDILLDYALRWYQGILTREMLEGFDPFWVGDIWAGAAKKHLEIDAAHPRVNVPIVETPDGLKPCVAIFDSYDRDGWTLAEEKETEYIEFIRSELGLPETQEPMWYYCHGW